MPYVIYVLTLALAAFQMHHYTPLLPDTLATHFDFAGHPNGWMTREGFFWFYGILLFVMIGVFGIIGQVMYKLPNWLINVPHKKYWLAPERRIESIHSLQKLLHVTGAVICVYIALLMQAVIVANLQDTPMLGPDKVFPSLGVLMMFIIGTLVYTYRRFPKPPQD